MDDIPVDRKGKPLWLSPVWAQAMHDFRHWLTGGVIGLLVIGLYGMRLSDVHRSWSDVRAYSQSAAAGIACAVVAAFAYAPYKQRDAGRRAYRTLRAEVAALKGELANEDARVEKLVNRRADAVRAAEEDGRRAQAAADAARRTAKREAQAADDAAAWILEYSVIPDGYLAALQEHRAAGVVLLQALEASPPLGTAADYADGTTWRAANNSEQTARREADRWTANLRRLLAPSPSAQGALSPFPGQTAVSHLRKRLDWLDQYLAAVTD
ncbi:MAG: hypothetical protein JWM89_260 [Acidimicrobiales bacterium]|nr:hypothetical protein [Acidimicrobiales bacterium]